MKNNNVAINETPIYGDSFIGVESAKTEQGKFAVTNILMGELTNRRPHRNKEGVLPQEQTNALDFLGYVDDNGNNIILEAEHTKLMLLLAQLMEQRKKEKEAEDYINTLPVLNGYDNKESNFKTFTLTYYQLAKALYPSEEKIQGNRTRLIQKCLIDLSKTYIPFFAKDACGNDFKIEDPLIILEAKIKNATNGNEKGRVITLGRAFLYGLLQKGKYQLIPNNIFELWDKYGNNTDMFRTLLMYLLEIRGTYINKAKDQYKQLKANLKKEDTPTKILEAKLSKSKKDNLTQKLTFDSILEKLNVNAYYNIINGKKYIKKTKFKNDLKKTSEALINMGIISKYEITKSQKGEDMWQVELKEYEKNSTLQIE